MAGIEPTQAAAAAAFAAAAYGLLRTGLELAMPGLERLARRRRARLERLLGRRRRPAGLLRPLGSRELEQSAYLLRLGFRAGGGSVQGALRYGADLTTAPAAFRAACAVALGRLNIGYGVTEALDMPELGPDGARLFRLLAALWEVGPEAVDAALESFERQMRRRLEVAGEVRGALLPLKAIRWVLRAGLVCGIASPAVPIIREGWAAAGPLIVLYPLLAGVAVAADIVISRLIDSLAEGVV